MASPGVELSIGMTRDPAFGPIVVLAAGGIYVELFDDRVVALPPVDDVTARRLVDRLRCRPLLDGARGGPPVDVSAVVAAVVAMSQMAVELGSALTAVDVNPLIAGPDGVQAVDVLLVGRQSAGR